MPVEVGFILERLAAMAADDASLREKQPWKAAYERDYGWLGGAMTKHYAGDDTDAKLLIGGVVAAFADWTVEAYEAEADAFLHEARHPSLGRLPARVHLRADGRAAALPGGERLHGLHRLGRQPRLHALRRRRDLRHPARARRSAARTRSATASDEHGGSVVYHAQPDVFDDGPAKPVRIWSRIGRRPIVAVGNSNGDIPMLRFASHPSRPSLSLLVKHDDAEREFVDERAPTRR